MAVAADEHVRIVGQAAPPAVAVADRDHRDARVLLGHELAPVAGALPCLAQPDLGHVGAQLQRRLERPGGGILAEWVHAVDGDAAAHHVELRLRVAQHSSAVGRVHQQLRLFGLDGGSPALEGPQLACEEARVAEIVSGGEMGHHARQLDPGTLPRGARHARCLRRVARTEAAHARIELDVDAPAARVGDRLQVALIPHHHVGACRQRLLQFHHAERAHHQDPHPPQARLAKLAHLAAAGDRQPAGAAGERRAGALRGAVAVAVGLDHRAQLRAAAQLGAQTSAVALDRRHVHARLRADWRRVVGVNRLGCEQISHPRPPPRAAPASARRAARRSRRMRPRPRSSPPGEQPACRPGHAARRRRRRP